MIKLKKAVATLLAAAVFSLSGIVGTADYTEKPVVADVASTSVNASAPLDGTYYIRNVYSGKYLDVSQSSPDDGANIQQYEFISGSPGQQFRLVSDDEGYYSILTASSNFTKAVDIDGWGTENGVNILQWEYHGGDCQKFEFVSVGDCYAIKTKITDSTKCLDIEGPSGDNGANVHQWDYYENSSQWWILESIYSAGAGTGGNASAITEHTAFTGESTAGGWDQAVAVNTTRAGGSFDPSKVTSNGCFYVEYSGEPSEIELIVQSWSGGSGWGKVNPSETGSANGRNYAKFSYDDCAEAFGSSNFASLLDRVYVGSKHESITVYKLSYRTSEQSGEMQGASIQGLDGTYYIKNVNSGKYLEVDDGSSENGANIYQHTLTGADAQKFRLVSDGNGYYTMYTGASGYTKVIDVAGANAENGANIQQWEYNGADCQRFEIVEYDGYLVLKTKVSGSARALDVDAWGTKNLSNVIQWDFHGGECQLWVLEDVNKVSASGNTDNIYFNWTEGRLYDSGISGGYPRLYALKDGTMLLGYDGMYVARSNDDGLTWHSPVHASQNYMGTANAAFFQADDGTIYLGFRSTGHLSDGSFYSSIQVSYSTDNGYTWQHHSTVYENTEPTGVFKGVWEPHFGMMNGYLTCFYANDSTNVTTYQNIEYKQWDPATRQWINRTIVCNGEQHRSRDGMPVWQQLSTGEYVCVIEAFDKDNYDNFAIKLTYSYDGVNWSEPVTVMRPTRSGARCAAPYVVELPTGQLMISCQSNERISGDTVSTTTVISDGTPVNQLTEFNFTEHDYPFYDYDGTVAGEWNGMYVYKNYVYVCTISGNRGIRINRYDFSSNL